MYKTFLEKLHPLICEMTQARALTFLSLLWRWLVLPRHGTVGADQGPHGPRALRQRLGTGKAHLCVLYMGLSKL